MTASRSSAAATMRSVLDRLTQLAALDPDWDSYGAAPPSAEAVATARQLVLAVAERLVDVVGEQARPFAVAPLADGCVQLTWRGPSDELEVEIGPRDDVGYLLVKDRGGAESTEVAEGVTASDVLDLVERVLLARDDGRAGRDR
jgi:hypothetical protein